MYKIRIYDGDWSNCQVWWTYLQEPTIECFTKVVQDELDREQAIADYCANTALMRSGEVVPDPHRKLYNFCFKGCINSTTGRPVIVYKSRFIGGWACRKYFEVAELDEDKKIAIPLYADAQGRLLRLEKYKRPDAYFQRPNDRVCLNKQEESNDSK